MKTYHIKYKKYDTLEISLPEKPTKGDRIWIGLRINEWATVQYCALRGDSEIIWIKTK